jgi:peptide/nickel transport system permease protein
MKAARLLPLLGLSVLLIILGAAAAAPLLFPAGPWLAVGPPYTHPFVNPSFPLGTDTLGRNVLAGLLYGAQVSLWVGVAATLTAMLLGTLVGAIAGSGGRRTDDALMRFTEIFQTIPSFIFLIMLVTVLRPTLVTIVFAIATVSWPPVARLVRGEVLALRERDFVQSCRLLGVSPLRILFAEILPNCLSPVVVTGSIMVATSVLLEAGLAFLGLSDPNLLSWGTMVAIGRPALRSAPYLSVLPGLAILATVMAINLVGEALTTALNPRLRGRPPDGR